MVERMDAGMITFTIPGSPIPLDRARHGKGKVYDTPRNKSAKRTIGKSGMAAMVGRKPIQGPVRIRVAFLFEWPKSYTQKRRKACYGNMKDTKPDIDNLAKMVMDALNGIAYDDDSQVCEITATKYFSQTETCTRVMIEPLWRQDDD